MCYRCTYGQKVYKLYRREAEAKGDLFSISKPTADRDELADFIKELRGFCREFRDCLSKSKGKNSFAAMISSTPVLRGHNGRNLKPHFLGQLFRLPIRVNIT